MDSLYYILYASLGTIFLNAAEFNQHYFLSTLETCSLEDEIFSKATVTDGARCVYKNYDLLF